MPQLMLFSFHTQITLEALPNGQVLSGDKQQCKKFENLSHCTINLTSNLLLRFVTHPVELNWSTAAVPCIPPNTFQWCSRQPRFTVTKDAPSTLFFSFAHADIHSAWTISSDDRWQWRGGFLSQLDSSSEGTPGIWLLQRFGHTRGILPPSFGEPQVPLSMCRTSKLGYFKAGEKRSYDV